MSPESKVNTRLLTHHLFRQIETRGRMASGFAVALRDGSVDMYKDAVTATQLPLGKMPRNARHGILHTRYATQGPVSDNINNHPVTSPEANIALVHNGVIFNDSSIRRNIFPDTKLAAVDTSVIPALIEAQGTDGLKELMGDAAIAWIDQRASDILHVARVEGSPLFMTTLTDGSVVFASTLRILSEALDGAKLEHTSIMEFSELDYATFKDGEMLALDKLPETKRYSGDYSWRWQTSGGHGSRSSVVTPSGRGQITAGTEAGDSCSIPGGNPTSIWDDAEWLDDLDELDFNNDPMALAALNEWVSEAPEVNCFYTLGHWGDWLTYSTVEDLVGAMKKFSVLPINSGDMFPEMDDEFRYLERIGDMGFVDKAGHETSFISDPSVMDQFPELPAMIREGAELLRKAGAMY